MESMEEQDPSEAPTASGTPIPLTFAHPSDQYRKIAVLAALVVSIGSFFGSMIGEGEANYDLLGLGAFGCCFFINTAFIFEAVYNYKRLQYNELHGLKEKNLKLNYVAAVSLAIFGLAILFGNLLDGY